MSMKNGNKLSQARSNLEVALNELEQAQLTWSTAVTNLHMADLGLRKAQKHMRECYHVVASILSD